MDTRADLSNPKEIRGHGIYVVIFYSLLFTIFFIPVLVSGSLLTPPSQGHPGDALLYHLPFFHSSKALWDDLLGCGFPMTADPQVMAWYPPSLVFSLLPGGWNMFVISAYVMASCFTYGYVYALTHSKLAAAVSGLTYGMSGFMMAHLVHTTIIHVAAWPPLIIWALHLLRSRFSAAWLAVGSLAVACCILAGHFHLALYGIFVALCYAVALGWTAPIGRVRYYAISALIFVLGVGLAALQILPTAQLAKLSTRSDFDFLSFVSYSLPYKNIPLFFYPAALGGLPQYGRAPYFGDWNLVEMTGYVGLLPLMLAGLGFLRNRRQVTAIFWLCVTILAVVLALGERTPLAFLMFKLPVVSQFRAPARHLFEVSLAVSVLAGLGVQAIARRGISRRLIIGLITVAGLAMTAGWFVLSSARVRQLAIGRGGINLDLRPWSNPAIGIPLLVFLAAATLLTLWHARPGSWARRVLLISVLIGDLASFGWFFNWPFSSPPKSVLNEPSVAADYGKLLRAEQQRLVAVRGTLGQPGEVPPNISKLWKIPSATLYSPLAPSRTIALLSMRADGSLDPSWKQATNQTLNLTATRYVILPRVETTTDVRGVEWSTEDIGLWLGDGCNQPRNKLVKFEFGAPIHATTIGIVSRLACSVGIPDGTEVARVSIIGNDGRNEIQSLLAGHDTAEWAYDCRTVKSSMKHKPAEVFSSFPATMNGEACDGHFYVTRFALKQVRDIARLEIMWTGQSEALSVEKITIFDTARPVSFAIDPVQVFSTHWRRVKETEDARVYENLLALPRVWLTREAVVLDAEQTLTAIKTSRFADGRYFDPRRTALVEEAVGFGTQPLDPSASARVVTISNRVMTVATSSANAAFLVTSDTFYPGWQVWIDEQPAKLYRADFAFRGVAVPAGNHLVRFEYRPGRFYFGAVISATSVLFLFGLVLVAFFRNHRDRASSRE
jgi:hypothetical protein